MERKAVVVLSDSEKDKIFQCYHSYFQNFSHADNSNKKVMVGMSGGVDSSVCAFVLQALGYQVEGLFMKNWEEDDGTEYCSAAADLADAQAVCDRLGIKLRSVNFAAEYWDNVFEHFLDEYSKGRTPNPDILCNKEIKFKAFLEYAIEDLGSGYIATGHYARVGFDEKNQQYQLLTGLDQNKDQSYFLYTLKSSQLAKVLFPIGEVEKTIVREIAEKLQLSTAAKKDSTGICFIGERKFKEFLSTYLPAKPGIIKSIDGQILGEHDGLMYHTLGQRKGLKIGGVKNLPEEPWYVVAKDVANNELIVAQGGDNKYLLSSSFNAVKIDWVNPPVDKVFNAAVKIRYRSKSVAATIEIQNDDKLNIIFAEPQIAVTPGQSVVIYQENVCLGGAIIDTTVPIGI